MTMTTTLSPFGLEFLEAREGFRSAAYPDSAGIPTIGYGTTHYPDGRPVQLGDACTETLAQGWLDHDILGTEQAVSELVTARLSQHQFDALVSFVYNVGVAAFKKSTLLRLVNLQMFDAAAEQFLLWDHDTVDGKLVENAGLKNRRTLERELFLTQEVVMSDASPVSTPVTPVATPASFTTEQMAKMIADALAATAAAKQVGGFVTTKLPYIVGVCTFVTAFAGGITGLVTHAIDVPTFLGTMVAAGVALQQTFTHHNVVTAATAAAAK